MIARGRAIMPRLARVRAAGDGGGRAIGQTVEVEFARDHRAGEIPLADEVGHDENIADFGRVEEQRPVAQGRFLLPEHAGHLREEIPTADGGGVDEARRGGIRVEGRAVADDEQSGGGMVGKGVHGRGTGSWQ